MTRDRLPPLPSSTGEALAEAIRLAGDLAAHYEEAGDHDKAAEAIEVAEAFVKAAPKLAGRAPRSRETS